MGISSAIFEIVNGVAIVMGNILVRESTKGAQKTMIGMAEMPYDGHIIS